MACQSWITFFLRHPVSGNKNYLLAAISIEVVQERKRCILKSVFHSHIENFQHEKRQEQHDWLTTNTDDIISQSHSPFLIRAKKFAQWKWASFCGRFFQNSTIFRFKFVGTVELENLPLRKTALQGLELPLEVRSGFIGRLKLSIPFRHPKSEPWIIHIDKLYLIAGPLSQYQVQNIITRVVANSYIQTSSVQRKMS